MFASFFLFNIGILDMLLRFFFVISILVPLFLQAGCNEKKEKSLWQKPQTITEGLSYANTTPSNFAVIEDELAVLYSNNNTIKLLSKNNKVLIEENVAVSPQNIWLKSSGKYVYVFWWQKYVYGEKDGKQNQAISGKSLFVRASNDFGKTFFPKVRVNSDEGVLPELKIAADEVGNISVIYSDERLPAYQVYTNSSHDGGKTWLKKDIRLDKALGQEVKKVVSYAGTPHIVNLNDKLIAIWQQYDENNGNPTSRIIARESTDNGDTWGDEIVISQYTGNVGSTLDVIATDDELYALWLDKKKKGLVLFSKKDKGKWIANKEIAPGTENASAISWVRGVADDDFLYLTYTFEKKPYKNYVVSVKYERKKSQWSPDVHRLDRHSKGVQQIAKAQDSDIILLPNNTVLSVWEDYDAIVPGIDLDFLTTKDQKWRADKIRSTKPGLVDARTPKIYLGKDKVWVVFYYTELTEGKPPFTGLAYLRYDLKKDSGINVARLDQKMPDNKESEKIIRQKSEIIWKSRLSGEKEKEWAVYDPVFRSKFRKDKWVNQKSGLSFDKFIIDNVSVQGKYGRVTGKVTYKLPENLLENKVLDAEDTKKDIDPSAPIETSFSFKFGWFYDDWFYIPEVMFMNHIGD